MAIKAVVNALILFMLTITGLSVIVMWIWMNNFNPHVSRTLREPSDVQYLDNATRYMDLSHGIPYVFNRHNVNLLREEAREMFYVGYENYMQYAWPYDELDPVNCRGRGPDFSNADNTNINDALGNYQLTLIDSLSTLAVVGNATEFRRAVGIVISSLNFDRNSTVSIFEATIRIMGGLLSAHLISIDASLPEFHPEGYAGELLELAVDLANRLLVAFNGTATGIPYARLNLRYGVSLSETNETCTACAGSLIVEWGILSRLTNDERYEHLAWNATKALWKRRGRYTNLMGNVIDVQTGEWTNRMSGVGAGIDSFFEYLLKAYIIFGDVKYLNMFRRAYEPIKSRIKRTSLPIPINVDYETGLRANSWVDSLSAFFPGLQVLAGDVEQGSLAFNVYSGIWSKYNGMPERYNLLWKTTDIAFSPLRPELTESAYLLYKATRDPKYLKIAALIMRRINKNARNRCGYATLHTVHDPLIHEGRMESFFLAETCKYLFLIFDTANESFLHRRSSLDSYIFTTEGHPIRLTAALRLRSHSLSINETAGSNEQCFPWKVYGSEMVTRLVDLN